MARLPVSAEWRIDDMTCDSCARRIEGALGKTSGVIAAKVSYKAGLASVMYDPDQVEPESLIRKIEKLGYRVRLPKKLAGKLAGANPKANPATSVVAIALILIALYLIARRLGLLDLFNQFPLAEAGMGFGLLFVIGLLTSVHCIAMCGAINLTACSTGTATSTNRLLPSLLYNTGRVISYTVIGGIVGALGSVVTFSSSLRGIIMIVTGILMMIMGLNMLGIFPWLRHLTPRLPRALGKIVLAGKRSSSNRPLIIGLLNGLMPCGPLQAMQLYALSTGSPVKGALSMLIFSLGTVPLMFGFGAASSFLSQKSSRRMLQVSSLLVVFLGFFMLQNGLGLSGIGISPFSGNPRQSTSGLAVADPSGGNTESIVANSGDPAASNSGSTGDFQIVRTRLQPNAYEPITVKAGQPVRWIIEADEKSLNGCNTALYVPEYDLTKELVVGDNVIEFTPQKAGVYPFSCWMGMIRSQITVID